MFLFFLLQTNSVLNEFMLSLTGTTIKNLGLEALKNTSVLVPSDNEQKKVGTFFNKLD